MPDWVRVLLARPEDGMPPLSRYDEASSGTVQRCGDRSVLGSDEEREDMRETKQPPVPFLFGLLETNRVSEERLGAWLRNPLPVALPIDLAWVRHAAKVRAKSFTKQKGKT
jgi:hypothetical protein